MPFLLTYCFENDVIFCSSFYFSQYNVTTSDGVAGSGGEYDVQVGFGWTNGVILSLLDEYAINATGKYPKFRFSLREKGSEKIDFNY